MIKWYVALSLAHTAARQDSKVLNHSPHELLAVGESYYERFCTVYVSGGDVELMHVDTLKLNVVGVGVSSPGKSESGGL